MNVSGFYILGDLRKFWAREYATTIFRDYIVDMVYQSISNVKRAVLVFYFGNITVNIGYSNVTMKMITQTEPETLSIKFYREAIDKVFSLTQPKRTLSGPVAQEFGFLYGCTIRQDITVNDLNQAVMPCVYFLDNGVLELCSEPAAKMALYGKVNYDVENIPILYFSTNQPSLNIMARDFFDRGVSVPTGSKYKVNPKSADFLQTYYVMPITSSNS